MCSLQKFQNAPIDQHRSGTKVHRSNVTTSGRQKDNTRVVFDRISRTQDRRTSIRRRHLFTSSSRVLTPATQQQRFHRRILVLLQLGLKSVRHDPQ